MVQNWQWVTCDVASMQLNFMHAYTTKRTQIRTYIHNTRTLYIHVHTHFFQKTTLKGATRMVKNPPSRRRMSLHVNERPDTECSIRKL